MQINANKVLDFCLKVWYKGANANDSHYHLEEYTKMYGCSILPEPTVATQDWVHRGYAMAFVQDALRMGWIAMDNSGWFQGVCALAYVCNFQTAVLHLRIFLRNSSEISLDRWKSYIPLSTILSYLFFKCQSVGFGGRLCQFSSVFTRGIDVGYSVKHLCTFSLRVLQSKSISSSSGLICSIPPHDIIPVLYCTFFLDFLSLF